MTTYQNAFCESATKLLAPDQVHRGIKGVVQDSDGNGIKGATISVRGIRKDITTGKCRTCLCVFLATTLCFQGVALEDMRCFPKYQTRTAASHQSSAPPPPHPVSLCPAEDGDYWRLLNPGTYILTATAKGHSKVSKRVHLPNNMNKAGRVDFVLEKVWFYSHCKNVYIFGSPLTQRLCFHLDAASRFPWSRILTTTFSLLETHGIDLTPTTTLSVTPSQTKAKEALSGRRSLGGGTTSPSLASHLHTGYCEMCR